VNTRIAAYGYPQVVWSLDDLPQGATGKILSEIKDA
jgi:hypothetical protein